MKADIEKKYENAYNNFVATDDIKVITDAVNKSKSLKDAATLANIPYSRFYSIYRGYKIKSSKRYPFYQRGTESGIPYNVGIWWYLEKQYMLFTYDITHERVINGFDLEYFSIGKFRKYINIDIPYPCSIEIHMKLYLAGNDPYDTYSYKIIRHGLVLSNRNTRMLFLMIQKLKKSRVECSGCTISYRIKYPPGYAFKI